MQGKPNGIVRSLGMGNFHVLLGCLLFTVFLVGYASDSSISFYIARISFLAVIFAALRVIADSTATRLTGKGAMFLWLVTQLASFILGAGRNSDERFVVDQIAAVVEVFTLGWVLVMLIVALMHMRRVSAQALSASLCAYLMLGIWFFAVYALLPPTDFSPAPDEMHWGGLHHTRGDLFYFSFVTLASLGYGDVTPVSPLARSLAILEVVLGQFYLAVLIARQVGLYLVQRGPGEESTP
jgi:hypothetical protein